MAKLTGPLMSLSASGTIANTLSYANWKGIQYARTRVIPANPQSTGQTATRTVFAYLQDLYKFFPGIAREPWVAAVTGIPMTSQNMLLSKNTGVLRLETNLDLLVLSPGARGGIPATGVVATPGSGSISVDVTAPAGPSGWTLTAAQGVVVRDQDPHLAIVETPIAAEDTTSTYTLAFSGLAHAHIYQLAVWLKWLTPGSTAAYSIATRAQVTTT